MKMAKSKRHTGLGKGLGALLPVDVFQPEKSAVQEDDGRSTGITALIELKKIQPNPYQPRQEFDRESLEDLKNSIREKGIIQPITVRRQGDRYELISGERRVRASIELGLEKIPAYIIDVESDNEMLELALIENIQRANLNPVEIALGYRSLIEECHLTQEEVAQKVGKDRATVANFLRLLKLPQEILDALRSRKLSMGHARALLSLPDKERQLAVFQRVLREELSVRKTEQLVRQVLQGATVDTPLGQSKSKKKEVSRSQSVDATIKATAEEIEDRLRQVLGTQVKIHLRSKDRGSIEISFYSLEDLQRLLELFAIVEKSGHSS